MTNIIEETQLDYSDVLIKPKRSTLNSRKEPCVYREYHFKWSKKIITGNGLMVSNMATTGTLPMARAMSKNGMFTCLHKHIPVEDLVKLYREEYEGFPNDSQNWRAKVFISTGIRQDDFNKFDELDKHIDDFNICIDIANGYIPTLLDAIKTFRIRYKNAVIMVGNVVTGDMVQDLILNGADIVKIGIGPGANCITRKETGVGRPQLSAIIECAEAAHAVDGMICADGGVNCVGDICKAYGAGADFVMVGSMVAGTDEADGDIIEKEYETNEIKHCTWLDKNGYYHKTDEVPVDSTLVMYCDFYKEIQKNQYKLAYGMSSQFAQDKHWGGMNNYRTSEGIVTLKPYVGSVQNVIDEYLGGLRSCMTYIGAKRLKDIPKCCTFYRVNRILNNDGKGI